MISTKTISMLILSLAPVVLGCRWGNTVWTDPVVESRTLDSASVRSLEIRTHNGSIAYSSDSAAAQTTVTITRKGGGSTHQQAQEALAAIEVFVEPAGGGQYKIGYRWKEERSPRWNAAVSFEIVGPASVSVNAESHNGEIALQGVQGDVRLMTHNGRVQSESAGGVLSVETHNGRVEAAYGGPSIRAVTHNGSVTVDLREASAVGGVMATHNGSITLVVSEKTSAMLSGRTSNGAVGVDVPLSEAEISRTRVSGKLGAGGEALTLETHNGTIRVRGTAD